MVTQHDHLKAVSLHYRIGSIISIVFVCTLAALLLFSYLLSYTGIITSILKTGFVSSSASLLVWYSLARFNIARNYEKNAGIRQKTTIKQTALGIKFKTVDGEALLRWENIFKWKHDQNYLLIYPAPNLFHIIPKKIADSGFDLDALTQALQTHVGNAK